MQRIVQACPEVAAASQLQQLCSGVQVHVPDLEQNCIMVQWMMQEVADLGISGITWNPAKVSNVISTTRAALQCPGYACSPGTPKHVWHECMIANRCKWMVIVATDQWLRVNGVRRSICPADLQELCSVPGLHAITAFILAL